MRQLSQLSVVVPCFNEAGSLRELHRQLSSVCAEAGDEYEIIFIDDGSGDETLEVIRELAASDPHTRGVALSRNFGHQAALSAGLDRAGGDAVVVMDADLQHPPGLIAEFVEKWRAGYDIVYGFRRGRPPRVGYRAIHALMQVRIPAESADFRLMDRKVVDAFRRMPERSRFIRGMVSWLGFNATGVGYRDRKRYAGERSYTLHQTLRMALNAILSFSLIPLRVASLLGLTTLLLGLIYGVFVLASWWRGQTVEGWTGLVMTVLILGGVQLLCLGIIAEYIGRIYEEVKRRPLYVVRETIGRIRRADAVAESSDDLSASGVASS